MIKKIYIKDFAIINELELQFQNGLTVITGETGSGKSIILQALNVSLGGNTNKTMLRSNADRSIVETKLNSISYRRIINKSGRTKSYINDEPRKEKDFRVSCKYLVDFHGQHEQQFIMNETSHIDYLDAYCDLSDTVEKCSIKHKSINSNYKLLSELTSKYEFAEQQRELLSYQLNEINSIDPRINEDTELELEFKILNQLDSLIETVGRITNKLTDSDNSIYDELSMVLGDIEKIRQTDTNITEFIERLESALINIQDTSSGLNIYISSLNNDKKRLVEIQDRLGAIDGLKRKYGGSIESIEENKNRIKEELKNISNIDKEIEIVNKNLESDKQEFSALASKIHIQRIRGAKQLAKAIESELSQLRMPEAKFEIFIFQKEDNNSYCTLNKKLVATNDKGIDNVQFLLSANPGEKLKPLVDIASGGEISRIMLAIKSVFQSKDPVDVLVFDEIDSGISGVAAEKVAQSLLNLANHKQVICITHLPQIAEMADNHLHIVKSIKGGHTTVTAKYLNKEQKQMSISQLSANEQLFT